MLTNGNAFSSKPWIYGIESIQLGVIAMVTVRAPLVSNSSDVSLYLGWQLGSWRVFYNVPVVSSDVGFPCMLMWWRKSPFMYLHFPQCQDALICYSELVRLLGDCEPIIQSSLCFRQALWTWLSWSGFLTHLLCHPQATGLCLCLQ